MKVIYNHSWSAHMMSSNENIEMYSKHSKRYDFDCMKFILNWKQTQKYWSFYSIDSKLICRMLSLQDKWLEFDYLTSKLNTFKKRNIQQSMNFSNARSLMKKSNNKRINLILMIELMSNLILFEYIRYQWKLNLY